MLGSPIFGKPPFLGVVQVSEVSIWYYVVLQSCILYL